MPLFAAVFMIVTLSSIGLPGTNGFVGEFLVLLGAFGSHRGWAVVATTGVILAAVYMLWMFQRVMFGTITHPENEKIRDMTRHEFATLIPLLVLIFWIGIYPKPFLDTMDASVKHVLEQAGHPVETTPEGMHGLLWFDRQHSGAVDAAVTREAR
jgi:NADH-quinone oxidoreductase subunit M